ncbi:uncharacterized protein EURHEDRAFT_411911, partial [Aspergillus ruber CBS 135680]
MSESEVIAHGNRLVTTPRNPGHAVYPKAQASGLPSDTHGRDQLGLSMVQTACAWQMMSFFFFFLQKRQGQTFVWRMSVRNSVGHVSFKSRAVCATKFI